MSDLELKLAERRLVRKLDLHIMPWLCISYLLNYIDRTNLGNARTLNNSANDGSTMGEQLNLTGNRYSIVVAIFFVFYLLFEFPSNFMLKRFGARSSLARIMATWGIVTCCTAAVTTFGGLLAVRICLAIAEAGFFPGCLMYMTFFYTSFERATRIAVFLSFVSISGVAGGLIATGVSYLNHKGGLYGWQWLFTLEGIPPILMAFLIWFFLPDYPETCSFLTAEEKVLAAARLGAHAPKSSDKAFVLADVKKTLFNIDFYLFAVTYFCLNNCLNGFSYFAPTIIAGLGFKGPVGQALTIPPNVFAFFVIVGNSWLSDRRQRRPEHILAPLVIVALGFILLATVKNSLGARYFGVICMACTNAAVAPLLALRTSTVSGSSATAVATAGIAAFANISGITAPFIFAGNTAPFYTTALWVNVGFIALAAVCVCALWYRLGPGAAYIVDGVTSNEAIQQEDDILSQMSASKEAKSKVGAEVAMV